MSGWATNGKLRGKTIQCLSNTFKIKKENYHKTVPHYAHFTTAVRPFHTAVRPFHIAVRPFHTAVRPFHTAVRPFHTAVRPVHTAVPDCNWNTLI